MNGYMARRSVWMAKGHKKHLPTQPKALCTGLILCTLLLLSACAQPVQESVPNIPLPVPASPTLSPTQTAAPQQPATQWIPFIEGDFAGVADDNGQIVAPPIYRMGTAYQGNDLPQYCVLELEQLNDEPSQYFLLNQKQMKLLGPYEGVQAVSEQENLFCVREGQLWGAADLTTGQRRILPQYSYAFYFSQGKALVSLGDDLACIDAQGNQLFTIPNASPMYGFANGRCAVYNYGAENAFVTLLDESGNNIPLPEGVRDISVDESMRYAVFTDDRGICGVMDMDGNILMEAQYLWIQPMGHTLLAKSAQYDVYVLDGATFERIQGPLPQDTYSAGRNSIFIPNGESWTLMRSNGLTWDLGPEEWAAEEQGGYMVVHAGEGIRIFDQKNRQLGPSADWYAVTPQGDVILQGVAHPQTGRETWALMDAQGKLLLEGYQSLYTLDGLYFQAQKGSVFGIVDRQGNWILRKSVYQTLVD